MIEWVCKITSLQCWVSHNAAASGMLTSCNGPTSFYKLGTWSLLLSSISGSLSKHLPPAIIAAYVSPKNCCSFNPARNMAWHNTSYILSECVFIHRPTLLSKNHGVSFRSLFTILAGFLSLCWRSFKMSMTCIYSYPGGHLGRDPVAEEGW